MIHLPLNVFPGEFAGSRLHHFLCLGLSFEESLLGIGVALEVELNDVVAIGSNHISVEIALVKMQSTVFAMNIQHKRLTGVVVADVDISVVLINVP